MQIPTKLFALSIIKFVLMKLRNYLGHNIKDKIDYFYFLVRNYWQLLFLLSAEKIHSF